MDLVHHELVRRVRFIFSSSYRKTYMSKLRVGTRPAMKIFCENYQARVKQVFPVAENQTQICRRNHLYIEI